MASRKMTEGRMKGYFGVGVEGLSKPHNAGNLLRTAHAFGASFFFAVAPDLSLAQMRESDTSGAAANLPLYHHSSPGDLALPAGCRLIGVELTEAASALPSFRHPRRAAYVLGPERGRLSPEMQARCDHMVRIPMAFCVNVGVAGAIVLYDRMISLGRFAERPVRSGGPAAPLPAHVHGGPPRRRGEPGAEAGAGAGGEPGAGAGAGGGEQSGDGREGESQGLEPSD